MEKNINITISTTFNFDVSLETELDEGEYTDKQDLRKLMLDNELLRQRIVNEINAFRGNPIFKIEKVEVGL